MKRQISFKTFQEVIKRSHSMCEVCGRNGDFPLHHVFAKSQYYGKDRDFSWNLVNICTECHRIIHFSGTSKEIVKRHKIDYKLKKDALERYHGDRRPELSEMVRRALLKTTK